MKLLKFKNGEELLVDLCFNNNLVTIKSPKINTSGFKVCSEDGRVVIRNASAFTTLYDSTEDEYILSSDGSVKPEPKPYEPTESEIVIDGTVYEVYDFNGKSFLTTMPVDEARATFKDVTTIVHDTEVYKNLEFVDCYSTEIEEISYTQVVFYQKNEVEVRLENLEESVAVVSDGVMENFEATEALKSDMSVMADGIMENFEATEALSERTNTQEDAILELYEMIGGNE